MRMPSDVLLTDIVVRPHHKGFPPLAIGRTISELRGRLTLTDSGFVTPVLLLAEGALHRNMQMMQKFCDAAAFSLAPHVKTTMSPEIISKQLDHRAWAVTVATFTQAATVRTLGVDRILIANELVDPTASDWLGCEMDRDERFTGYCYIDSVTGVHVLEETLTQREQSRRMPVLIEFGLPGGRAGVRTVDDAVALADLIQDTKHLRLAGVAGFEGIAPTSTEPGHQFDQVIDYLRDLRNTADRVYDLRSEDAEEFIVTVGGSCFVELVRDELGLKWRSGRPIRVVLRAGCYITHDSVAYEEYRKLQADRPEHLALTAALELWARVISRPEPDLAILDFGKRDVGTDAGLPVPQHVLRRESKAIGAGPSATVVALDDQHGYLKATPCKQICRLDLEVGDLVGFGISHPCTTFDKWRLIPMVDNHRTLTGAVQTLF